MDYEKEYKEALERAREYHKVDKDNTLKIYAKGTMEYLFPVLKESEDEKMLREIKRYIKEQGDKPTGLPNGNVAVADMLAWLENVKTPFINNTDNSFICDIKNIIDEAPGVLQSDKNRLIAWLEKQGRQEEPQVYETENSEVITYSESEGYKVIKPKFHDGDWVVNKFGDSWHIDSFDKKNYQVSGGKGNYNYFPIVKQDEMHLWTIKDAKDGDVLISKYGKPFIYNGNFDSFHIGSYCGITTGGSFNVATEKCQWTENENIHPATKEQRDLLFQKVKEAGYEWDAEKKEVKKIHVIDEGKTEMDYCFTKMMNGEKINPAWSEEDERLCSCLIEEQEESLDNVKNDKYGHSEIISDLKDMYHERIDWLKSLKERMKGE